MSLGCALIASGCYGGSFNGGAGDVFACETDEECPRDQLCVLRVCVIDEGPHLEITGPEPPFGQFATDTTSFDLTVVDTASSGFVLGPPEMGDGYLRIFVDGEELERLEDGDLSQGVDVDDIPISSTNGGVHRVRVMAVDTLGEPIGRPAATADRMFFVDDPNDEPQIAVLDPFPQWPDAPLVPQDYHDVGVGFSLVIAGIGFDWDDPDGTEITEEGHTHVYVIDDYPDCLPGCNDDYVGSLKPGASTKGSGPLVDGEATTMLPTTPGRLKVTAGLQWNTHTPYPAPTIDDADWDQNVRDGLVNDGVQIEFFDFDSF
jgi:hypothetical protein